MAAGSHHPAEATSPAVSVAFLGPAGTFTEAAMQAIIARGDIPGLDATSDNWTALAVSSPAEAFAAVRAGQAQWAVVASENSVDGAVTATFDAFVDAADATEAGDAADAGEASRLQIFREVDLPVEFSIMQRPGFSQQPATIATHPVAYQQIRRWLARHYPGIDFVPASSNAAAADMVAQSRADLAAAPARAAEIFQLETIAEQVADIAGAVTRFVLVGRAAPPPPRTGRDRTSVVVTLPNEPGSLVRTLDDFARRGVDLSRIESRPTRTGLGSYRFYIDIIGHIDDEPVAEALRAVWLQADDLAFLGSWPASGNGGEAPRDLARLAAAHQWVDRARTGR